MKTGLNWREIERMREEFWSSNPIYRTIYERMRKQGYHFIGRTGSVKRCYWTREAIVNNRFCYKCLWYGIESHRCIQMTPVSIWCWNRCLHCWRIQPDDIGMHWDETTLPVVDEPEIIVEESIRVFKQIIGGFKGSFKANQQMVREALEPKHVAISLTGEPLLYPRLSDLIKEYHRRGFTTFLVTRGVRPDVLTTLDEEPSQLYISLEAWCREKYVSYNKPFIPKAWDLILKTIEYLPSFKSPTVFRITIIKGFNDSDEAIKGFKKLVEIGNPTYIEVKAYMYMGYSKSRLKIENMPSHSEIRDIARKLSIETGYMYLSESIPSRIVLLSRIEKPIRHGKGCPDGVKHPEKYTPVYTEEYEELTEENQ
ncbi:MAG: 4-demethylwyosine synthase TYW1 [Desulfurococcaceae archaeon]